IRDRNVTGVQTCALPIWAGPGDLFVAVAGIHVDGHNYLGEAVAGGAAAVAIERGVDIPPGIPVLRMPATRIGLAELSAEFHGRQIGRASCREGGVMWGVG